MTRPLILDLYSGAGGASMGYFRAGFDVVGVDIHPQPRYPFEFHQQDALAVLASINGPTLWDGRNIAAIHASPPCQRHSKMTKCRPGLDADYPDLIVATRELLKKTGLPYAIENVPGSPLIDPITLCGFMFGYELYRHRLFESNRELTAPPHPAHTKKASRAGHWVPGTVICVAGHIAPMKLAREVMDISWTNREELAEAIPPYYAEWVGKQLLTAPEKATLW